MPSAPTFPPFLADITDSEISGTKTLVFKSTAPVAPPSNPAQHTIDGKKFDGEVGATVGLNKVEEWKIVNETYVPNQISHPFHIHINPFQISEEFDPNAAASTTTGTGTLGLTSGSTTVTGTGTTFTTQVQVGDFLYVSGGNGPFTVTAVASDTSLTVNNAAGGTASGLTYSVAIPLYTNNATTKQAGQCYIDPTNPATWKPCAPTEPATNRVWWDVFAIPSGNTFYSGSTSYQIPGYFKMRSRFV